MTTCIYHGTCKQNLATLRTGLAHNTVNVEIRPVDKWLSNGGKGPQRGESVVPKMLQKIEMK